MNIPNEVKAVIERLNSGGFEAYAVGGCARDMLLDREPNDWDITTSALPQETEQVFGDMRVIETGIKHGTVTVLSDRMPIEITTFRIDGEYFDGRHPASVSFTRSLNEDLKRRDFTMNAVALSEDGSIYDPFGGKEDIENGIIRCVGDPDRRFNEDALRIMRALRFASELGFEIEKQTSDSLRKNKNLLTAISAERLRVELVKLLCGKNCRRIIMEYYDVLGVFIPEILPCAGFDQRNRYHIHTVLGHIAAAVEAIPNEPTLRLAAFFHDIEKPASFTFSESDGMGHFYGHDKKSAETAKLILRRLKADNKTVNEVYSLIMIHDVPIAPTSKAVLRTLRKIGPELFEKLMLLKRADIAGQNPEYDGRLDELSAVEEKAAEVLEKEKCFSLADLKINGNDIISEGIASGKKIGSTLNKLLEAVIDGECENERGALLKYAAENK